MEGEKDFGDVKKAAGFAVFLAIGLFFMGLKGMGSGFIAVSVIYVALGSLGIAGIWYQNESIMRRCKEVLLGVFIGNLGMVGWFFYLFCHEANNPIECDMEVDDSCYFDSIFQVIAQACYMAMIAILIYFDGYLVFVLRHVWRAFDVRSASKINLISD